MTDEELINLTDADIEEYLEEMFELNYERMRLDGGHNLTPDTRDVALRQVKAYYRKLREVAENVTDTEVRLTLPGQKTPENREFTIEGIVDIVRDNDRTVMYDIKTHEAEEVRKDIKKYADQLNVYAHIWQNLRQQELEETAIIATGFPSRLLDARRSGNVAVEERLMEEWDPLVPIPFDQEKVQEIIADFANVVDCIEGKSFAPPPVEVLIDETASSRAKFGTRICRNCDARFSCSSFRNFVVKTNARTGIDFKRYYSDFGSDDELVERAALSLQTAVEQQAEVVEE